MEGPFSYSEARAILDLGMSHPLRPNAQRALNCHLDQVIDGFAKSAPVPTGNYSTITKIYGDGRREYIAPEDFYREPPTMTEPTTLTDAELLAAFQRTDGESAEAEALLAEVQRRHLDI